MENEIGIDQVDHAQNIDEPSHKPSYKRKFILCFDGTGNKFSGTDSDSNILKIYRMLDRTDHTQFHYYQPGIGTYVTTTSLTHKGHLARLKSWYLKAKDSAIGSSLDQHVMGGYKFLMRYYRVGDEIYLFGFSRGAYTARFLAEMIDHIGLLSQGNEELIRFAWKTFQKWQIRQDHKDTKQLLEFMSAFRETFSRPVQPIQFLGIFDTVNSVPQFESALMSRTKFPYTARSTARIVRHAVSIDERRAKFRQDLIGEKPRGKKAQYRRQSVAIAKDASIAAEEKSRGRKMNLNVPERYRDRSEVSGARSRSPNLSARSQMSRPSFDSFQGRFDGQNDEEEDEQQDIQEVWFSGCHADNGGGWAIHPDEEVPLSHIPLVWMVREARKSGVRFDPVKVRALHCAPDEQSAPQRRKTVAQIPQIVEPGNSPILPVAEKPQFINQEDSEEQTISEFERKLHVAATKGKIHDVLCFKNGAASLSVVSWNFMEWLPFRRMDLQSDGSWKPISWPLPKGETRDVPDSVVVHNSVLRRMRADPTYRPGNLICGGGGRGVRRAPVELGMGNWKVLREEGDLIGEVYVRDGKPAGSRTNSGLNGIKKAFA